MSDFKVFPSFKSSPDLIEKLRAHSVRKTFDVGSVILSDNSSIASVPLVLSGTIKVIRHEDDGREILLYYIKAGESCIMSFLGGLHCERSMLHVEVEEAAEILFLPMEKVQLFIKEYPQWLEYIFKMYYKRFEELLDIVNAIAFKKVDERLLDLLRRKSEVVGNPTIHTTHEQLANELGTARVVISRLLKQLESNGDVKLGRKKITLV